MIFKLVTLIYVISSSSKVDTSSMLHFSQRNGSLTKYYFIIVGFIMLDVYHIVMSFTVSLSTLVRLKTIDERVENYMRVTTRTALSIVKDN